MDTQQHVPEQTFSAGEEEGERDREQLVYAVALGERIRILRGKRSRQELADLIGVHVNTVGKFERGASMPDAFLLNRLCAVSGRSIEWLVSGTEASGMDVPMSLTAVEHGEYLFVPHFDVQASAGPGALVDVEKVIAMRPFELHYVREDLRIAHNELALLGVNGSSSEPILHSGDTVMVDRRDREVQAEGLHLLRMDDVLLVKLVQRLPGRALRISSRNEDFQPFDIKMDDAHDASVDILGRVRWGGVTFR